MARPCRRVEWNVLGPALLWFSLLQVGMPADRLWGQSYSNLPQSSPSSFRLPAGTQLSTRNKLYIELKPMKEPSRYGYSKVQFTVHSPTPRASSSVISVRATFRGWNSGIKEVTVQDEIELTAGASSATIDMVLPVYCRDPVLWWDLRVDGRPDRDLSLPVDFPYRLTASFNNQTEESLLILDASAGSPLAGVVDPLRSMAQTFSSIAQAGQGSPTYQPLIYLRQPLPEQVLDYTPFDIVKIDAATLEEQQRQRPAAVKALLEWVAAGGNLWVVEVGTQWQKLQEVSQLLGLDSSDLPTEPDPDLPPGVAGWQYLNLANLTTTLGSQVRAKQHEWREGLPEDPAAENGLGVEVPNERPVYTSGWFAVQRLGWGTVAAMPRGWESPPGRISEAAQQRAQVFWEYRGWVARHGLRPTLGNGDFSNFLIPGVGLAPVVEFQVLITLFVIVIGPVNYWLLKRVRKQHLMVLTVPALALLVTGALMLYGLMADGLGTRVRAMTITYLDEANQRASTWSRLSYYASFPPEGGLEFNRDTAIYPLYPSGDDGLAYHYQALNLEMKWTSTTQQLTKGWLRSRTPTQFLVVEPQTTTAGLRLRKTKGLRGTNLLGARLELALAIDEQGQWYRAVGAEPGQPLSFEKVDEGQAVTSYRAALRDREPSFPDGAAARPVSSYLSLRSFGHSEGGDFSRSLHSQLWQELLGEEGAPALALPPRRYIAVTHHTAIASLGVEKATEEASLHLVIGNW